MELRVQIKMNQSLFLRDPEGSVLGKKIIRSSVELISSNGFESFTFRKLAEQVGSTEASIYRYFENKHKLLVYLLAWYWAWIEYRIRFETNNITDPKVKLKMVIRLITDIQDDVTSGLNENLLHQIVVSEGPKTYLTKEVDAENEQHFFKPFKDLSQLIADLILACNSEYYYAKSLASTLIEAAHFQHYFMKHLPSLTESAENKGVESIIDFLNNLVFSAIEKAD